MKKILLITLLYASANLFAVCPKVVLNDLANHPVIYAMQALQSAASQADEARKTVLNNAGIKLASDQPNPSNFFNCIEPLDKTTAGSRPLVLAKNAIQQAINSLRTKSGPQYDNLNGALTILNNFDDSTGTTGTGQGTKGSGVQKQGDKPIATIQPSDDSGPQWDNQSKPILYALQAIKSGISATDNQKKIDLLNQAGLLLAGDQPNPKAFFNSAPALRGDQGGALGTAKEYIQKGIDQLSKTDSRYNNLTSALKLLKTY